MRRVSVIALFILSVAIISNVDAAHSQPSSNCPYAINSLPSPICGANSSPHQISSAIGGSKITSANCATAFSDAVASYYAYDDVACYSGGSTVLPRNGTSYLSFVDDAVSYLPPDYQDLARQNGFHATLYCDTRIHSLILAVRGSVSFTSITTNAGVADWVNTNFLQHLGDRPIQYRAARDIANRIKEELDRGTFDKACGQDRPRLIVTGHSKGGGQAQYTAIRENLMAVVFNSDVVNPLISLDWTASPDASSVWQGTEQIRRRYLSAMGCLTGQIPSSVQKFVQYYRTGNIRDVRMVNDVLATFILPYCRLPHADIEWLIDTFDCSEGAIVAHMMDTVVHELRACVSACTGGQTACP